MISTDNNDINKKNDSDSNNTNIFNQIQNQNDDNYFNPIIRNSLEYYDYFQPKIQEILNKIEYIKVINGININDEYIFYDDNNTAFYKSRIETLGMFIPQDNSWKWSWSIPFAKYQNNL